MNISPRLTRLGQQAMTWLQNLTGAPPAGKGQEVDPTPGVPLGPSELVKPGGPDVPTVQPSSSASPAGAPAGTADNVHNEAEAGSDLALDLSKLEKQIVKLGREQFKLNALLETQQQQVKVALQQLRDKDERQDKERSDWLARRQAEQAETRLQVIQRLLPVLDGLDEALSAGERLLERAPSSAQVRALGQYLDRQDTAQPFLITLLAWPVILLGALWPGLVRRPTQQQRRQTIAGLAADMAAWQDAQVAWLRGLEMVRERLLETLAIEDVQPIEALGQPFDPHQHIAVDTVPAQPDTPPGQIVSEARRGYTAGQRMLRYAEVVVARPGNEN